MTPAPAAATVPAPDHVNIVVRDMEASVAFYTAVLGLRKGFEGTLQGAWIDAVSGLTGVSARCVFLESETSPVRLELLQYENPAAMEDPGPSRPHRAGLRHLAFRVPDLDTFHEQAVRFGVTFISPPVLVPFPLPGGVRKRLCYFYDPDGVLLEAAEYRAIVEERI